jgi:hypothetical protein
MKTKLLSLISDCVDQYALWFNEHPIITVVFSIVVLSGIIGLFRNN